MPGEVPQYVPVKAEEWSRPMDCFPNVELMVKRYGGQQVYIDSIKGKCRVQMPFICLDVQHIGNF